MKHLLSICIITSMLAGCGAWQPQEPSQLAYETDNLTDRPAIGDLPDSLALLDAYVNGQIQAALIDYQTWNPPTCQAEPPSEFPIELHRALRRALIGANLFAAIITDIERWTYKNDQIKKLELPLDKTIYGSVGYTDWSLIPISGIAPSIKVNGVIMGTDKLGHFFADGHVNFEVYLKTRNVYAATQAGIKHEEGLFGLPATGVKSYGDLAANYAGLRFWMSILETDRPYLGCREGQLVQIRKFTWVDHVNHAWDEGINCSEFRNHGLGSDFDSLVTKQMRRAQISCPVSTDLCSSLTEFDFAACFVSPACWRLAGKAVPQCKEADSSE